MQLHLRNLREDRDITQKEIAAYLQCDQSLYTKYERGEREAPLHVVYKLALYYETSMDFLVGLTDENRPYPRSNRNK